MRANVCREGKTARMCLQMEAGRSGDASSSGSDRRGFESSSATSQRV